MDKENLSYFIISEQSSIVDAMEKIDRNGRGILFVTDEQERLSGALTDGDIRRFLLRAGSLTDLVSLAMHKNPISLLEEEKSSASTEMRKKKVTSLPIVNLRGEIIDILFLMDTKKESYPKESLAGVPVVIMAGGKGTRLYPYTKILPKPLIPIGETPIVERIMDYYHQFGVGSFFMTVNYKKAMIRSYFDEEKTSYQIHYVEETSPLGTGGSLKLIQEELSQAIFVSNCDALILADYADIYRHHKESGNALTMVSALKNFQIPYGVLHTGENGCLEKIEEKPKFSYFINTGMYVINPEVIRLIPKNTVFHMTHLVEKLMERGDKVGTYPLSEDSFLDMGEFSEMKRMEEKLNIVSE